MMPRLAGALGMLTILFASGCGSQEGKAQPAKEQGEPREKETSFASDRQEKPLPFDGKRAMGYLEEVCKIGPRISGTAGMRKQQELLSKHFKALGATVKKQTYSAKQWSQRNAVEMVNLIVSWHPDRQRRVILCTHYDTRPMAHEEHPRKWREPFLSANDGGSGVALLIELGNHMKELKTQVGVDFVFFDGEEYIFDKDRDKFFFGSEHFAKDYVKSRPKYRYLAAVLFDMIATPKPSFKWEWHSMVKAGPLVEEIWNIAAKEKCTAFVGRPGGQVLDDHLALNAVGIPAIDIIDMEGYMKHWHRLSDVPANCSKEGVEQVARVILTWLQRVR
jgi:hypothetical protein